MSVVRQPARATLVAADKAADYTLAAAREQEQSFVAPYELLFPRPCDFAAHSR
jgi:hypothetical protein